MEEDGVIKRSVEIIEKVRVNERVNVLVEVRKR